MNVTRSVLRVPDQHPFGSTRQHQPHLIFMSLPLSLQQRSPLLCPFPFKQRTNLRIPSRLHSTQRRTVITASSRNTTGNKNRLGPSQQPFTPSLPVINTGASTHHDNEDDGLLPTICRTFSDFIGKTLYKYYNWRQDTLSDLQLFIVLNAIVISLGAVLRRKLMLQPSTGGDVGGIAVPSPSDLGTDGDSIIPPSWWQDLYSVLIVVLGQELPEEHASNFPQQVFAVATAVLGVASFALVLALIEQATLELLESNVRRGSRVFEKDHYVILTYGESARDLSQCETILKQICAASYSSGGAVIVVLVAHREKLEMETLFRETLPKETRCGSQIVFRQGSPLDPGALQMVSAVDARAIIITGDYSRSVEDSDAQVLRCAVLVDELAAAAGNEWIDSTTTGNSYPSSFTSSVCGTTGGMGPWVVAEVQGNNILALLQYACTSRVIPVPTSTINARRYARLLKHPAVAVLSHALFDHTSRSNCHVGYFPEAEYLIGQKFAHLHAFFPDAIVAGVLNLATWKSELSCSPDRVLQEGEALIMLRSAVGRHTLHPLRHAMPAALNPGTNWDPSFYSFHSLDDAPLGKHGFVKGPARSWNRTNGTGDNNNNINKSGGPRAPPPRGPRSITLEGAESESDDESASGTMSSLGLKMLQKRRKFDRNRSNDRLGAALLPLSFGSAPNNSAPNNPNNTITIGSDLLICGWAGSTAMFELLKELDHGVEALPKGSCVILLNNHSWEEVSTQCSLATTIRRLEIKHVRCDPRDRQALSTAIDVATLRAAVILHDTSWGVGNISSNGAPGLLASLNSIDSSSSSPSSSFASPASAMSYRAAAEASAYSLSQPDMLRIDAAVLEVQLNVRYLLESACCPDINILSEKLTYLGETRFEHRRELPIGAAVNSASFAAKVLAQTAVQPRSLTAYDQVGVQCDIVVQDAAAFAKEGEELDFFTLQARCASISQVLMGYYDLPNSIDQVLDIVINPDEEDRGRYRVWNNGNSSCKLITLAPKKKIGGGAFSEKVSSSKPVPVVVVAKENDGDSVAAAEEVS